MAVPAMPGAGLVVVETEFVLGGLETVLDRPSMAFDRDLELAVEDVGCDHGGEPEGEQRWQGCEQRGGATEHRRGQQDAEPDEEVDGEGCDQLGSSPREETIMRRRRRSGWLITDRCTRGSPSTTTWSKAWRTA